MEIKIKNNNELINATIEIVDGVMLVSPVKSEQDIDKFKDGDILVCGWTECEWICILKESVEYLSDTNFFMEDYCGMFLRGRKDDEQLWIKDSYSDSVIFVRYATEEEKQKLFQALSDKGYEWDSNKKELVEIKWRPREGEIYWSPVVNKAVFEAFDAQWSESLTGRARYDKGWCFKTEEECKEFCQKLNEVINQVKP